ncbi:MAG: SH3 domain-containing protein [Anaerolineae bacterium]
MKILCSMRVRSIFGLIAVVLLLSTAAGAVQAADGPTFTVAVAALNLRQGPGTNHAILDVLRSGEAGTITGRDADGVWLQVKLADGRAGWVHGGYVTVSGDVRAAPVVQAVAAAKTTATRGNTIVFQTSSGGAIYAMNADGSNLRYLTHGMDPALSPDGRLVAFTRWMGSSTGVKGDLWVIGVDGTGERQVHGDVQQPKSPVWSSDGQTIVINIQRGVSLSRLMCVPKEFSLPPEATDIEYRGDLVCFKIARPWWRLRAVDVATGEFRDLPGDVISFAPTLDPRNAWRLVYVGDRGLVNLDITNGNAWPLTTDPQDHSPTFSPDGSKIAVSYRQTDHWEVHVMNADGTGRVRLTQTPMTVLVEQQLKGQTPRSWNNAAPAWSPDGRQIAFLSDRNGRWEIWVMNADGSNQRLLLPASALGDTPIRYEGMEERVISWR